MYLVFRIHVTKLYRTPMGPLVSTLEKACAKARKLRAAEKDPVFRYLVFGPHQPNASSSKRRQKGYRWYRPDQVDAQLPAAATTVPACAAPRTPKVAAPEPHPLLSPPQPTNSTPAPSATIGRAQSATPPRSQATGESSLYTVMRRLDGKSTVVKAGIATLAEARHMAHRWQRAEPDKQVEYYVLAPPRQQVPNQRSDADARPTDKTPPASKPVTAPTTRQIPAATVPSRVRSVPNVHQAPTSALEASREATRPSDTPRSTRRITFFVLRVLGQSRRIVKTGFNTLEEASQHALLLQRQNTDSAVRYEVESAISGIRQTSKPVARLLQQNRSMPAKARSSKRMRTPPSQTNERPVRSRRHDWEIEDRAGDIVLVHREPEEMGIGIPAQRGKGRRSRKGDYIP